jgi:hypothetical protein
VDQEFVPGITRGIVRCYLVGGTVVGFARQYPDGVVPDGPLGVVPATQPPASQVMGLPSPKTMYQAHEPALAQLRERLETDWVPAMTSVVGLRPNDLPALWDVDLLIADPAPGHELDRPPSDEEPRFVLCEINASSIIPFPPGAPTAVARHTVAALTVRPPNHQLPQ